MTKAFYDVPVSKALMVCETCVLYPLGEFGLIALAVLLQGSGENLMVSLSLTKARANLWALYIPSEITLCQNMTSAEASVRVGAAR